MTATSSINSYAISRGRLQIRFLGSSSPGDRKSALARQVGAPKTLAYLEQIHSDRVTEARPGLCGKADGLWTRQADIALNIATADCLPLIVADQNRLAVVHAGWRGICSGIVTRAVAVLGPTEDLAAWIGPAIGPCCYEVGPDVATEIVRASDESVAGPGGRARPHVDLRAAVTSQLCTAGVPEVTVVDVCTRCRSTEFWSYRASGPRAGRNLTFAWFDGGAATSGSDRFPNRAE